MDEVRKLEEKFDGLQAEHVPRAKNSIADDLSKRAALKLPMEPGIFVLQLTQPSVEPSAGQNKRRKAGPGKYFPAELPGAAGKDVVGCPKLAGERQPPAGPQVLTVEAASLTVEDGPLVLAVEPQAPAWAHHIIRFLQTGNSPMNRKT